MSDVTKRKTGTTPDDINRDKERNDGEPKVAKKNSSTKPYSRIFGNLL